MPDRPLLLWFRRDLRLDDHPMLTAAVATGRPLIPVFILDPETEALGAAPKWRLGRGLEVFAETLQGLGSRLIFRRGPALDSLRALIAEADAAGVVWSRAYDPASITRDKTVKAGLREGGLLADSHPGHLLHEPWTVETGQGGYYRVYTPFWKAVKDRPLPDAAPAPKALRSPDTWPASDALADWHLGAAMRRGADVVARYSIPGAAEAERRLADFLDGPVDGYGERRNLPAEAATSALSEFLSLGEIGPRRIWHAAFRRMQEGSPGAETFLKELVWREFAWHLLYHSPHIATANWREDWEAFPWRDDNPDAERWRQGMTGEPFVDAAMREMYVTGRMHNRARMIAGSYLTKHLLTHWRVGLRWFEDCLTDWDPASNAMGWQWVAGSGPDAAPYFRIFNPATQAEKFDPDAAYRHRHIAELTRHPGALALDYFRAVPKSWDLAPDRPYPEPLVDLAEGRARALAAYQRRDTAAQDG
ncbi:cryptochrome/photolyase family protein [Szabonella alba]|uniref:Deoxyribodipyrimidine photo-lyase n=1 Tax=Szabonella alba TaxID=2804194 RepID=A0A8K0XZW4_9RHOB|nr:deoxyribodipyrimidine photo-lyase [Szabonella alba]MBL4917565.1 deoxyribodipyrimidine photo-lyase [Szabonella alba]